MQFYRKFYSIFVYTYLFLHTKQIGEELETTGEGKGIGNQVQAEEERAQDWSTVSSAKEFDTKSSIDNAMITKMSTEEVNQTIKPLYIMLRTGNQLKKEEGTIRLINQIILSKQNKTVQVDIIYITYVYSKIGHMSN